MGDHRSVLGAVAALTTAAAGVVHIFAANAHDLGTLVGAGMAATAAIQVVGAVVLWLYRGRWVVAGLLGLNAAATIVAVLAHTTGLPVPGLRVPQEFDAQLVAVLCLEVAAVVALGLYAVGGSVPARAGRWLIPVTAVIVVATAVPAAAVRHDHATHPHPTAAAAHVEADHPDGAKHPDDGEIRYRAFTAGLAGGEIEAVLDDYERYFVDYLVRASRTGLTREQAAPAMDAAMKEYIRSGEGNGGHGHTGPAPWQPLADEATRDVLAGQLSAARSAAMKLPTAADAVKAGYVMIVPYLPGIGSHYVKLDHFADGVLDPAKPEILLYSGNYGDSEVVGLSYLVPGNRATPPEGFAGPNDGFHYHAELCWAGRMVVPVRTVPACEAVGGRMRGGLGLGAVWMSHVWVVPGWESPWGVFSPEHPDLTLAVGRPNRQG